MLREPERVAALTEPNRSIDALDLAALIAQLHKHNEDLTVQCSELRLTLEKRDSSSQFIQDADSIGSDGAIRLAELENILRQRQEELDQAYRALSQSLKREEDSRRDIELQGLAVEQLGESVQRLREQLAASEKWVFDLAGTRLRLEKEIARLTAKLQEQVKLKERAEASLAAANSPRDPAPQISSARQIATASHPALPTPQNMERLQALAEEIRACMDWSVHSGHQGAEPQARLSLPAVPKPEEPKSQSPAGPSRKPAEGKDMPALEQECAALHQRLEASEKIQQVMRESLDQEAHKYRVEAERAAHLHAIGKVLAWKMPWWWAFLPPAWRARRQHRHLLRLGAFDAHAYLMANPDVAAEGLDPVYHYLRHGHDEGRPLEPSGA